MDRADRIFLAVALVIIGLGGLYSTYKWREARLASRPVIAIASLPCQ